MERLTEKQSSGYDLKAMNGEWCNKYCEQQRVQTCNECVIYQAIQKLAEYENLEEQDLLLRLPCKVGDIVFKLKQHNYCPVGICRKDISCSECRANTPFGIVEKKFKLNELKEIGKTVFLTREEAEQKLKEMESD